MSDCKLTKVLVDFSNIARACWHPAVAAHESDPKYEVHAVFKNNLASKMETIQKGIEVDPATYIMALDSRSEWRRAVYPGYKANRDPNDYDPRPEAETFLRERFPTMDWAKAPSAEADDVIATLTARYLGLDLDVVIVSGDQDLWQLLAPKVRIFLPAKQKFVDTAMVAEKFDVQDPAHIRLHKAFWGDSSDGIPNCAPRMQKQLLPIIEASGGDLFHALALVHGRVNATCLGHLRKNLDQLVRNWQVVQLKSDVDIEWQ
jgi:DNA polymerase-1